MTRVKPWLFSQMISSLPTDLPVLRGLSTRTFADGEMILDDPDEVPWNDASCPTTPHLIPPILMRHQRDPPPLRRRADSPPSPSRQHRGPAPSPRHTPSTRPLQQVSPRSGPLD